MTVSFFTFPSRSPASIIATPIRSFTLFSGWKNSHLANTVAWPGGMSRLMRIIGVSPIACAIESKVLLRGMVHLVRESGIVLLPALEELRRRHLLRITTGYRELPASYKVARCVG